MAQATIISGSGPDGPVAPQTHYYDNVGGIGTARFPDGEPPPIPQHAQGLTFKAPSGLPLDPRQAGPDSLVTLPNGETWSAQALVYAGELVETPEGYRLAGSPEAAPQTPPQATPKAPEQPQQQAEQPAEQSSKQQPDQEQLQDAPQDGQLFSREVAAAIDDLAERVGDTATASLIMELADGREPSTSTLAKIASRLGCDPTDADNMVSHVRAAYESVARSTIESVVGPDMVDAVLEHARGNGTLADAINRLAGGSAEGFRQRATDYMANLDTIALEVILNAELPEGVDVRREGSSILVRTPDSQGFVTWPAAVKLGLIALGDR